MNSKVSFFVILIGILLLGGFIALLLRVDRLMLVGCCCLILLSPLVLLGLLSRNSRPASGVQWGGK